MKYPLSRFVLYSAILAAVFALFHFTGIDPFQKGDLLMYVGTAYGWWLYHFCLWRERKRDQ